MLQIQRYPLLILYKRKKEQSADSSQKEFPQTGSERKWTVNAVLARTTIFSTLFLAAGAGLGANAAPIPDFSNSALSESKNDRNYSGPHFDRSRLITTTCCSNKLDKRLQMALMEP